MPTGLRRGRGHLDHDIGELALGVASLEGVELAAEEAPAAGPAAGEDRDVAGNVGAAHGKLVAADRADGGVLDSRVGPIPRFHHVGAALVIALLADHRSDQSDRAHLIGKLLEPVRKLDALDGRGDRLRAARDGFIRMRVKGLELAGPARKPEHDQRPRRLVRALGLLGQQPADGSQPGHPGQSQETAAVDHRSGTEGHGSLLASRLVVPGEFRRVQQGPEQVGEAVLPLLPPGPFQAALKVAELDRSWPAREHRQVGGLHGLGVVGARSAIRLEALKRPLLVFSRTRSPFIISRRWGMVPQAAANSSSPVSP